MSKLSLGDTLEARPLEVIGLDASFGCRLFRQQALKYAPRHPDYTSVLADLDPELELDRLSLGTV